MRVLNFYSKISVLLISFLLLGNLSGCSSVPVYKEKVISTHFQQQKTNTYLQRKLDPLKQPHGNKTGFFLVANNLDALAIRTALIKKAEATIDVQYYLIHEDGSGRRFYREIAQAADRGVKVRILVDDIHLSEEIDLIKNLVKHPNVSVRVFNPFNRKYSRYPQFVLKFGRITRRMHNKALIVDNQISITGGRNIGDEYFQQKASTNFGDMDVVYIGGLVSQTSSSFDQYWNSRFTERLDNLEHINGEYNASLFDEKPITQLDDSFYLQAIDKQTLHFHWGNAQLIVDAPEKITKKRRLQDFVRNTKLQHYIDSAQHEVLFFTPYLVPTKFGIDQIKILRNRGVKITVLTNSLATTDVPIVHSGYIKHRKAMLDLGVKLYELKRGNHSDMFKQKSGGSVVQAKTDSLHAKLMVFDRKKFYIGSMNIDPRSINENTELGMVIDSPKVAGAIRSWFDKNVEDLAYKVELKHLTDRGNTVVWNDSQKTLHLSEPHTTIFDRIWFDFLSGLPIMEKHL